jgi:hypothetical protein
VAALQEIVWVSLLWLLFIGSLTGLAIGIGLTTNAGATLRFFNTMNRWVSSRAALKPMEIPRPVENRIPEKQRRWIVGALFIVGGLYASVLLAGIDASHWTLLRSGRYAVIYSVLFDATRWFLLVSCTAAVVMGVMLLFFPQQWGRLETWGNRWYSSRRIAASGDVMHFPLDRWVESSPRYAGGILILLSAVAVVAFGILLYVRLKLGLR